MAHLVRCPCGKKYRCDIEHPPWDGKLHFIEPMHERNCPDEIFHQGRVPIVFTKIALEKFKSAIEEEIVKWKEDPAHIKIFPEPVKFESISDIIEANSIKESRG